MSGASIDNESVLQTRALRSKGQEETCARQLFRETLEKYDMIPNDMDAATCTRFVAA
jgi:hypothetical protein